MKSRKCILMTLVMLFAMAITPGCGSKDNDAGDDSGVVNNTNVSPADPVSVAGRESCRTDIYDLATLKTAVQNMEFVRQNYPIVMYQLMKMRKRGIFWTSTNSTMRTSYENGTITHEYGSSKEAIRDSLITKLNSGTNYLKIGAGYHRVETSNGDIYDIDLCSPIAANPLNFYDKSANEYHKVTNWYYRYY